MSGRGMGEVEDTKDVWIQSWRDVRSEGGWWGDVDTVLGGVRFLGEVGLVWER